MSERDPYDFVGAIPEEDQKWLEATRRAKARQELAREGITPPAMTEKEYDDQRRIQAEAQRRLIAAQAAGTEPATPQAPPAGPSTMEVWKAFKGSVVYAPTWKDLKKRLKGQDGVWAVECFHLVANSAEVLAFFGLIEQGQTTPAPVQSFEVMVKDSIVFRSDPD
jgi:hypothetical protein